MSPFSLSPSAAAGAAGEATIQPEHAARRYTERGISSDKRVSSSASSLLSRGRPCAHTSYRE